MLKWWFFGGGCIGFKYILNQLPSVFTWKISSYMAIGVACVIGVCGYAYSKKTRDSPLGKASS